MSAATAALDPGEAIVAAMRELYDQLREIVDRGPTDDPGLLDEIGKLTGRIRRRITGARKKAEPAEEPTTAKPTTAPEPTRPASPTAAGTPEQVRPQTVGAGSPDAPTVPRHRAVPAQRREEYTVRLPQPGAGGRHRARSTRLPVWVHALVILLTVAGVTLGMAVSPSAFAALPATAVLLGAAHRLNARRLAVTAGGGRWTRRRCSASTTTT